MVTKRDATEPQFYNHYAFEQSKLLKMFKRSPVDQCITIRKNRKTLGGLDVFGRIGQDSKNGEVLKSCISKNKKCYTFLAIKKTPITKKDEKYIGHINDKTTLNNSLVFSELYILKKLKLLINNKICINVPFIYKYFICNDCQYENVLVQKYFPDSTKCLMMVFDQADTTISEFLLKKNLDLNHMVSAYLQVYVGIYCIKKFLGISHHDLHGDNVLMYRVPPGGVWVYKIRGRNIYIPNYGFLCVLSDFGYSRIPGKIDPVELEWLYKKETDINEDYLRITAWLKGSGIPIKFESTKKTTVKDTTKGEKEYSLMTETMESYSENYSTSSTKIDSNFLPSGSSKSSTKGYITNNPQYKNREIKTGDILSINLYKIVREMSALAGIYYLSDLLLSEKGIKRKKVLLIMNTDKKLNFKI